MSIHPLRRFATFLIRRRYWLLAIAVVMGVGAGYVGRGLSLNRSLEHMFAPDDPILVPYQRLQRTFGQHEIVLAVYEERELTSEAGLERVRKLAEAVSETPGVVWAVSILDPPGASDFEGNKRGELYREMFSAYTHNEELTAAGVICLIERPGEGSVPRREILAGLERIVAEYPHGAIVGEPVLVEEGFDLLEQDGRRLATWCTLLVMLTILACFRRVRWLVLPLAVIQLTLALTNGTLVASGLELSMVSSMLAAIITVVGVASVVHVMVRYQEERRHGHGRRRSLRNTIEEVSPPILVAIATDSAGFAALMVSEVAPVHDFGLMMAVGALMVLPACMLLAPGLMWLTDAAAGHAGPDDKLALGRGLSRVLAWSTRYVWPLSIMLTGVTIAAVLGTSRLKLETDFTRNFRQGSAIVEAYDYVEENFGGAGVWDLLVPAGPAPRGYKAPAESEGDGGARRPPQQLNRAMLLELLEFERELKAAEPHITKAISIADGLAAGLGGETALRMAPGFAMSMGLRVMRGQMPPFIDSIYHTDPIDGRPWLHVLLRSPERLDAEEKTELIDNVRRAAVERFPEAEVTGYYVLLANLIESLLADQWKAFLVSTVAVGTMILLALRDVRLTLITFVPNVFPSLILFGIMGWLGIRVNMGAAMIAAVSVGLAVDGSVHYTMFYQRLRRRGVGRDEALERSQDTVGRASVFSTLALTIGFGVLCVSDFVPTIYFGVLVSLSMVGGLIGNIVMLPALIRLVDRRAYG